MSHDKPGSGIYCWEVDQVVLKGLVPCGNIEVETGGVNLFGY